MGIKQISRIIVQRANGTANVLLRQGTGDWLINGARFEAQHVFTYTDGNVSSTNSQAVFVFKYMKNPTPHKKKANPSLSDKKTCDLIGYPLEAYKEIQWVEAKNDEREVGTQLIDTGDEQDSDGIQVKPGAGGIGSHGKTSAAPSVHSYATTDTDPALRVSDSHIYPYMYE